MSQRIITMEECRQAARRVAEDLASGGRYSIGSQVIKVYGIPRGGSVPAVMVVEQLHILGYRFAEVVDTAEEALIFIDDLVDSGKTKCEYLAKYTARSFYPLFVKPPADTDWWIFPWERNDERVTDGGEDIPLRLLQYIGEDPHRGGLEETPKRFLKAWGEWTVGYDQNPADILKVFEDGAEGCDELVLIKDIPVYSHCEHHLAPFFGVAHVGYIPDKRIVGLSKIPRLVDIYSKRLQVQERLTNQIANAIDENLKPVGVAVVIECRHMCMESRGIQRIGCTTVTSALRGGMKNDPAARAEFMGLIK